MIRKRVGKEARWIRNNGLVPNPGSDMGYLHSLNIAIRRFRQLGKKPRGAAYDYAVSRGIS